MELLNQAPVQDVKRLLELFPVSSIKGEWAEHKKGTKEEVCFAAASERKIERITKFLVENFGSCRQHIYIFSHDIPVHKFPQLSLTNGEKIFENIDHGRLRRLYLVKLRYNVVLNNPLDEATLEFIWPISIEARSLHLIVRFVTFEKNISSYFDEGRSCYVDSRSLDEKSLLQDIYTSLYVKIQPTDLHKGVKKLWQDGFIDSPKTLFKKALSTASEAMDEEKGIKEFNPELFAVVLDSMLLKSLFVVQSRQGAPSSVRAFSMEPSKGFISFPSYSDCPGDTDNVVNEILRHN